MTTTAVSLRQRRCVNHPAREASARCPECERFFCRECITEHDDRVLCASCLAKITRRKEKGVRSWAMVARLLLVLAAIGVVFLSIITVGNELLARPSEFHTKGGW